MKVLANVPNAILPRIPQGVVIKRTRRRSAVASPPRPGLAFPPHLPSLSQLGLWERDEVSSQPLTLKNCYAPSYSFKCPPHFSLPSDPLPLEGHWSPIPTFRHSPRTRGRQAVGRAGLPRGIYGPLLGYGASLPITVGSRGSNSKGHGPHFIMICLRKICMCVSVLYVCQSNWERK